MKPRTRSALFAAQIFAIFAWIAGCGEQAEGDRCDPRNGNADCSSGLVCRSGVLGLKNVSRNGGICCPPEGEPTDVKACFPNEFAFDAGTGGTGGALTDAAADAADASKDAAPTDAARPDAGSADASMSVDSGNRDARADALP